MSTSISIPEERECFVVPVVQAPVQVAENTYEVRVAKPYPEYNFCAGQSMKFCFGDEKCRSFSMVSAPHEDYLAFVYRGSGSILKKSFASLHVGTEVEILDARGVCTYPENERIPVLMLVGGVGVAPCISMFRHAVHIKDSRQFTLLYANRRFEDIAYYKELDELKKNLRLSVEYFVTGETPPLHMREGRFSQEYVAEHIKKLGEPIVYVIGAEGMVDATLALLSSISYPEDHIKVRKFTGYLGEDDT